MKKIIAALICSGILFSTGVSAFASETGIPSTVSETPETENSIGKIVEIITSNLTDEQREQATDALVDILTNKEIMNDAAFLLESFTDEQIEVFMRMIFNIMNTVSR